MGVTLILGGCQHCGGALAPDESVYDEYRTREMKCLSCGRVDSAGDRKGEGPGIRGPGASRRRYSKPDVPRDVRGA